MIVVLVEPGETLLNVLRRVPSLRAEQRLCLVFPRPWQQGTARERKEFFGQIEGWKDRVIIAAVEKVLLTHAREEGVEIVESRAELRALLHDTDDVADALEHFTTSQWQQWRQEFYKRLERLSSQHVRVWVMLLGSAVLFGTVLFVSVPSATIRVWPRKTLVSHTANIMLIASGAVVEDLRSQNMLPLLPITVSVDRALTFDQISPHFTGENAETLMTIVNESNESYSLRAGTRLMNQAGMIFRLVNAVFVEAGTRVEPGTTQVRARAQPLDIYQEVIGERGNVPAGLHWEIPGLPSHARDVVYARNLESGTGGVTRFGTLVQEQDIALAQAQIEEELLRAARFRIREEVERLRSLQGENYVLFEQQQYEVLTRKEYAEVSIPRELVGESVNSIPVEGSLTYTMLAYNKDAILEILAEGLRSHIKPGYVLSEESIVDDRLAVHVVGFDDGLQWVKVAVDLTGAQRAILGPTTQQGRLFAEKVRTMVQQMPVEEAKSIVQNYPEVDRVRIHMWPPWHNRLPSLSNHIVVRAEEE